MAIFFALVVVISTLDGFRLLSIGNQILASLFYSSNFGYSIFASFFTVKGSGTVFYLSIESAFYYFLIDFGVSFLGLRKNSFVQESKSTLGASGGLRFSYAPI